MGIFYILGPIGPIWGPMGPYGAPWAPWALADGPWASRTPPWGYIPGPEADGAPWGYTSGPEADGAPWAPWASGTPPLKIYTVGNGINEWVRGYRLPGPLGPQKIDLGPPGPIKSGQGPLGDKMFKSFQLRGSIQTNFHGFSRFLSIFQL